jgi:hypothetical protein
MTITISRVANIFTLCHRSPARFSRLSERLASLAARHEDGRLWALSTAANEQRHMLNALRCGDTRLASEHSKRVGEEIVRATRS